MPTYEYQCEKCNQTFEVFQSMKDEAYTVCPKEFCRLEAWGAGQGETPYRNGRRSDFQRLRFLYH